MRFLSTLFLLATATHVSAQDRPNTILVMDGSGSMWGQIEGTAKITIAQEVVGKLLTDFPDDQGLGLTVYGHRERSNCTDIETMVAPAPGNGDAITSAVKGITPLGKTPMTDAVIAAAEALRYTEDSATVILVSDGVETCNPDPCAAARLLEEAGINFTAHVIGFDVSDPEALAQMQCIAEETGGQFLTAASASELDLAMTAVVMEPTVVTTTLEARLRTEDGAIINDPVLWDITGPGGVVANNETGNPISLDLAVGEYEITAYRITNEQEVSETKTISETGDPSITIVFPEDLPTASLSLPETAPVGSDVMVDWVGPDREGDHIITTLPGDALAQTIVRTNRGNPAELRMPTDAGTYDIHYVLRDRPNVIIGSASIEVTPVTATLDAPDIGLIGETISIDWTGPNYDGDYIVMAQEGGSSTLSPQTTRNGSPVDIQLPSESGTYEIRYRMRQGATILARKTIEVTGLKAALNAPDTAVAGDTIAVGWEGPDYDRDFIAVAIPGERGYINYTYTSEGTPLGLQMPPEAGDYEIRYMLRQDNTVIATKPISVTAPEATLNVPDTAIAGETIVIGWTGPNYTNDFVAVGVPGDKSYINYSYTSNGDPLVLQMPAEPGEYEIRYTMRQDNTIIATQPINVIKAAVALTAPDNAIAGETITVDWVGPNYEGDFLAVGIPDDAGYINYSYTSDGNPLALQMPPEPGRYEIRYTLRQDNEIIARRPITVSAPKVSISAPDTAVAGSTVIVDWTGPDYERDYIAVGQPGASRYENYTYTSEGSPLKLLMPTEAGSFEIRYTLNQDAEVLASQMIDVTPVKAQITAPEMAIAGETLRIAWEGPGYDYDFISVGQVGNDAYANYTYINDGNPLDLLMPALPGDYEIRYQLRQDNVIIARQSIAITAAKAQLIAPDTQTLGAELIVGWDGPDYDGDYVGIARVGETGYDSYAYTGTGNPLTLRQPDSAGDYELRYFLGQDGVVIGTRPITITE